MRARTHPHSRAHVLEYCTHARTHMFTSTAGKLDWAVHSALATPCFAPHACVPDKLTLHPCPCPCPCPCRRRRYSKPRAVAELCPPLMARATSKHQRDARTHAGIQTHQEAQGTVRVGHGVIHQMSSARHVAQRVVLHEVVRAPGHVGQTGGRAADTNARGAVAFLFTSDVLASGLSCNAD
jgi:hypothetical protein